jgi:putative membrane protein
MEVCGQMMNGYGDGGWWALAMMFMSLAFIALIVVGVVFVVRSPHEERPPARPERNRALDLLDERFARGEIDQAEYEERRRVLTDGR